jgi:hypothetical protein
MSPALVVATARPAASTPRGPPLTSSTSVVATTRNPDSNPQGVRHRCIQHRWWPLLEILTATPRGPAIDVFNIGGGSCRTCRQQLSGGSPSTSPASVVATTGTTASTPRGAAINAFNIGGGCCRKSREQPLGGPPSTSSTSVVAAVRPAASTP